MAKEIKTKKSFGSVRIDHTSPAVPEAMPKALNLHISFEEAMRLHLGLGQALAKLNHPNVVSVHDVGTHVPGGHASHESTPPQPSPWGPQRPPQSSGVQLGPPQGPQSIVPPQPSPESPQLTPSSAQLFFTQPLPPH